MFLTKQVSCVSTAYAVLEEKQFAQAMTLGFVGEQRVQSPLAFSTALLLFGHKASQIGLECCVAPASQRQRHQRFFWSLGSGGENETVGGIIHFARKNFYYEIWKFSIYCT